MDAHLAVLRKLVGEPDTPAVGSNYESAVIYRRAPDPKGAMGGFGYDYFQDHTVKREIAAPALLNRTGLWGAGGDYAYEALNLVDGRRTVGEIRDALAAIYGPLPLPEVIEYLGDLEKIGVLQDGRRTMLREKLIGHHAPKHPLKPDQFRWRSREISRLEGLSDAVFGFAITLLIVALEVPRTSGELLETMRGFAAFAFTFAVLYMLWYRQFIFFRRYGLEDRTTVVLNGALLFVILFFTFPLKFLFTTLMNRLLGFGKMVRLPNGTVEKVIEPGHLPIMLGIYGLGSMAIFGIFALLYVHAYRQRHELELNELETAATRCWPSRSSPVLPAWG